jgi:hypothetical protein
MLTSDMPEGISDQIQYLIFLKQVVMVVIVFLKNVINRVLDLFIAVSHCMAWLMLG